MDVIVTPSLPITPPRIDQTMVQQGSVTEPVGVALTHFTRHSSLTGHPCMSFRAASPSSGLPIGMQIAGPAFDESIVLRVAHAYEQDAKVVRASTVNVLSGPKNGVFN